jgi:ABC-type tungstate transport system permease subunit
MTVMHRSSCLRGLQAFITAAVLTLAAPGQAQDRSIMVASNTSTEQSGLFGHKPCPS